MRKPAVFILILLASLSAQIASFKPGQAWLDVDGKSINAHGGGILYDKGTYYWFGERRVKNASGGVNVYSSADLYNWKLRGIAFAQDSAVPDIKPGGIMERPKVIYNPSTRKYVMWLHLELPGKGYDSARVGIAQSDSVIGPYHFVSDFRPNGNMSRDQTVFMDDDGKPYHFYSSRDNYDMRIHAMTADFLQATTADQIIINNGHREAPAVFKYKGRYQIMTSDATGWTPNAATIHTATTITGPWTLRNNPCVGTSAEVSSTFQSQSAFILPVPGYANAFIYIGDRWISTNVETSTYIWLPITFKGNSDTAVIAWSAEWTIQGAFGTPTFINVKQNVSRKADLEILSLGQGKIILTGSDRLRDLTGRAGLTVLPAGNRPSSTSAPHAR